MQTKKAQQKESEIVWREINKLRDLNLKEEVELELKNELGLQYTLIKLAGASLAALVLLTPMALIALMVRYL